MSEPDLTTDPRNARKHDHVGLSAVEKSLSELGAGRSIVVDKNGVIIGGNATFSQAQELGLDLEYVHTKGERLVVVVRDDLDTNDPRRKALALADNKTNDLSMFDPEIVAEILKSIKDEDSDILAATAFDEDEIDAILDPDEWTPPDLEPPAPTHTDPADPPAPAKAPSFTCPECGHTWNG